MSEVKRYLDTRKTNYAHDVARIVALLEMNGWQGLANAIQTDFAAPTMGQQLADFMKSSLDEPTEAEMFEAVDVFSTGLSEERQRDMAARLLCRVNGLDPDEKTAPESQAETLAAWAEAAKQKESTENEPQRVDAGPPTL